VQAILFDADGVIQRTRGHWREQFVSLLGSEERLDAFAGELFAAEKPCLTGHADFAVELASVLERWNGRGSVDDALQIWLNIEVDAGVIETIAALRDSGIACCLASNQHARRARHMDEVLGYRARFDRFFYSCRVGFMKPDTTYFERVLDELALPPEQVVFIDDVAANVASAQRLGIRAIHFPAYAGSAALIDRLAGHGVTAR
jgi:putative hydrolase of the HAD superfamily